MVKETIRTKKMILKVFLVIWPRHTPPGEAVEVTAALFKKPLFFSHKATCVTFDSKWSLCSGGSEWFRCLTGGRWRRERHICTVKGHPFNSTTWWKIFSDGAEPEKSEAVLLLKGQGEEDQLNKVAFLEDFSRSEELYGPLKISEHIEKVIGFDRDARFQSKNWSFLCTLREE